MEQNMLTKTKLALLALALASTTATARDGRSNHVTNADILAEIRACCECNPCGAYDPGITWIDELNEIGIDCTITDYEPYEYAGETIHPPSTCACYEFAAE